MKQFVSIKLLKTDSNVLSMESLRRMCSFPSRERHSDPSKPLQMQRSSRPDVDSPQW